MFIYPKFLSVSVVLVISLLSLGYDISKLQAGLEVPTPRVLALANDSIKTAALPKPISNYTSFQVPVSAEVSVTVYAREVADAKANVFMVHGAGGGAWVWEYYFEHMPKDYNLYALSWRGHFDSTKVEDASAGDYVADQSAALSFIQAKNNLPVHIIGHSYGGAISVLQVSKMRAGIASLILLAPVVPLDYTLLQSILIPRLAPFFIEHSNEIESTYGNMFLAKSRMRKYHELYAGKNYSREKPGLIAKDGVSPAWQQKLIEAFRKIKEQEIPVSIVIARYDNVVVTRRQHDIGQDMAAKVIELESGHYIPLDAMALISVESVISFIEEGNQYPF